jgi:hypothetical protein
LVQILPLFQDKSGTPMQDKSGLKINLGMGAILFTLRAKELRISFEASFAD